MFVLFYFSTYWALQHCHLCVAAGVSCAIVMMHIRVRTKYTTVRAVKACAVCLSCRYVLDYLDCMESFAINVTSFKLWQCKHELRVVSSPMCLSYVMKEVTKSTQTTSLVGFQILHSQSAITLRYHGFTEPTRQPNCYNQLLFSIYSRS